MQVNVKSLSHPKFGIFQVLEEPLLLVMVSETGLPEAPNPLQMPGTSASCSLP